MGRRRDLDLYISALLVLYWRQECISGHGRRTLAAAEYTRAVAVLAELCRHNAAMVSIGRAYRARLAEGQEQPGRQYGDMPAVP